MLSIEIFSDIFLQEVISFSGKKMSFTGKLQTVVFYPPPGASRFPPASGGYALPFADCRLLPSPTHTTS
jgi:hypothetical protein